MVGKFKTKVRKCCQNHFSSNWASVFKQRNTVFENRKRSFENKKRGRPSKIESNKKSIISFVKRPDRSYYALGKKDTVMWKKSRSNTVFRSRHYLMHQIRELDALYEEHEEKTTFPHFKRTNHKRRENSEKTW